MASKRIKVKIKELGKVVGGATPSTKNPENWEGSIPWLTPKDLANHRERFIKKGEKSISQKGYESCSTKMLPKGTVLFSSRAPIGYCAIAENDICTNQGFKSIVPNENTDSLFLYYLLKNNVEAIASNASGTTFLEISGKAMEEIEVSIPEDKNEQIQIAKILDAFDRKIENNHLADYAMSDCASFVLLHLPIKRHRSCEPHLFGQVGFLVRRIVKVVRFGRAGSAESGREMQKLQKRFTTVLNVFMTLVLSFALVGCNVLPFLQNNPAQQATQSSITTGELEAIHEPKFGGSYLDITIDEFNNLGFEYGDSVDVTFSNGYKLSDIPYYNGYYTKTYEPLVVAYPGYPYIDVCINNGEPLWETAGLKAGDTATVTLHEKQKYATVQKALNATYTNNRSDYASDEVFANFRPMKGGNLAEGVMYRSASPIDNQNNRAPYAADLAQRCGVQFILDLADTNEEIQGYYQNADYDITWHKSLYDAGNVAALNLNSNYRGGQYAYRLVAGLREIILHKGPYLIHCTEGKDRTGFVCALLEALCGASYDEMRDDYMITYDNYYGINEKDDKARYDAVVDVKFDDIARCIAGVPTYGSLDGADYAAGARKYLTDVGMTEWEINKLIERLTSK